MDYMIFNVRTWSFKQKQKQNKRRPQKEKKKNTGKNTQLEEHKITMNESMNESIEKKSID